MTDPTCEQRIDEYQSSRAAGIAQLFAVTEGKADRDEDGYPLTAEDAEQRIDEQPLSVEVVRHVKILFGTGGPADWLDAELDDEGDIRTLVYHFADWGDHASRYVEKDSPLWRVAERYVDGMYFVLNPQEA